MIRNKMSAPVIYGSRQSVKGKGGAKWIHGTGIVSDIRGTELPQFICGPIRMNRLVWMGGGKNE